MRASVRPVLGALLLAGVLAGCGSGKVNEANRYVDAVNRAQNQFAATIDRLSSQITPTSSLGQDRSTLRRFDGAVGKVVTDLRAVRPPARVRSLHGRLVGEIAGFGDEVHTAGRALTSRDPDEVLRAQAQLATATARVSREINGTIAAINDALHK